MHTDGEWKRNFESSYLDAMDGRDDFDSLIEDIEALLKREREKAVVSERMRMLEIIHSRIMESKELTEIDILEIVQRELLSDLGE